MTEAELRQRLDNVAKIAAARRAAETCARGHSRWRVRPGDGRRHCLDCQRDREREARAAARRRDAATLVAAGLRVPKSLVPRPGPELGTRYDRRTVWDPSLKIVHFWNANWKGAR